MDGSNMPEDEKKKRSELPEEQKNCSELPQDKGTTGEIALARCNCLMARYLRWKKDNLWKSDLAQRTVAHLHCYSSSLAPHSVECECLIRIMK